MESKTSIYEVHRQGVRFQDFDGMADEEGDVF